MKQMCTTHPDKFYDSSNDIKKKFKYLIFDVSVIEMFVSMLIKSHWS